MSYRTFASIESDAWAFILAIDPCEIRGAAQFFVLDTATIQPGLTDRSGVFHGTINDNKSDTYGRTTEMNLFDLIGSNVEFWVGIQQGPSVDDPIYNTWTPGAGGRRWIMGGWITNRYYTYGSDKRVTAVIEGKDYMALWRDLPFGTIENPRDYSASPVDVSDIIADLLLDVNNLQDADWQFTPDPDYFYPNLLGKEYQKEYKLEDAFSVMQSICLETNFEWQIVPDPTGITSANRRRIRFYPRVPSLYTPSDDAYVHYETNFRSGDKIQVGDTSGLITDVIFSNQGLNTVPPNPFTWVAQGVWMDAYQAFRTYNTFSMPIPPNSEAANEQAWFGDVTQIIDTQGYPAVCFQKPFPNNIFNPVLAFYTDPETQKPTSSQMQLDFRIWRSFNFNFRHVSRHYSPAETPIYRVKLHNTSTSNDPSVWLDYYIMYDFTDLVPSDAWETVSLPLPEVSDEGVITNMNGWTINPYGNSFDPTKVDFVSFQIACNEALNNIWLDIPGGLTADSAAGSYLIKINQPENYFFRGPGFIEGYKGEIVFGAPMPMARLGAEWVFIYSILGDYGGDYNVKLGTILKEAHGIGAPLQIPGAYSIAFSHIYFEKPQFTKATLNNPVLANPRRFRFTHYSEVEFQSETRSRAEQELLQYGLPKQKLEINVDGDARHLIGSLITVYLDPVRGYYGETDAVFQGVDMMIDDVIYTISGVDLQIKLTMGNRDLRSASYSPVMNEVLSAAKARRRLLGKKWLGTSEAKIL